jgi:hypothetical protein
VFFIVLNMGLSCWLRIGCSMGCGVDGWQLVRKLRIMFEDFAGALNRNKLLGLMACGSFLKVGAGLSYSVEFGKQA